VLSTKSAVTGFPPGRGLLDDIAPGTWLSTAVSGDRLPVANPIPDAPPVTTQLA
jgi:hypothetical protein